MDPIKCYHTFPNNNRNSYFQTSWSILNQIVEGYRRHFFKQDFIHYFLWRSSRGLVAYLFDYGILVSKFQLKSRYYIRFWNNTLRKGKDPIPTTSYG